LTRLAAWGAATRLAASSAPTRLAAWALAVVLGIGFAGHGGAAAGDPTITPGLTAYPIERFGADWPAGATRGPLTFLGGLEIESDETQFGSLSGAVALPGGSLTLVSDTGLVWRLALGVTSTGAPAGPVTARGEPIRDEMGQAFPAKDLSDAEGLTLAPDGRHFIVTFETYHRVLEYPIGPDGGLAPGGRRVAMPEASRRLRYSKGLEAIAVAPSATGLAGALVAIAERPSHLTDDPDLPGWIVGGPREGAFHIVRIDRFDATDAAFLGNGDLLLLERRIHLGDGPRMRLRRFKAADLVPGARIPGEVLLEASGRDAPVDNMEALVVEPDAATPGRHVRITVLSDNNRSILQRTLMIRFLLRVD
jgi:hypothetical protein